MKDVLLHLSSVSLIIFKFQENSQTCLSGQHFSLRQLGICEPPSRRGLAFCSEMGLPHRGFSVGTPQDLDADSQAVMSPERAMRLWGRGGLGKSSGRSSCLSSRSNSVLTLTDTEHENKSDSDNGRTSPWLFLSPLSLFFPSLCLKPVSCYFELPVYVWMSEERVHNLFGFC